MFNFSQEFLSKLQYQHEALCWKYFNKLGLDIENIRNLINETIYNEGYPDYVFLAELLRRSNDVTDMDTLALQLHHSANLSNLEGLPFTEEELLEFKLAMFTSADQSSQSIPVDRKQKPSDYREYFDDNSRILLVCLDYSNYANYFDLGLSDSEMPDVLIQLFEQQKCTLADRVREANPLWLHTWYGEAVVSSLNTLELEREV